MSPETRAAPYPLAKGAKQIDQILIGPTIGQLAGLPQRATMKQYRVFHHPSGKAEAVKQGWSWPASLFSVFWAPFKGLWVLGVGGLLALAGLGYLVASFTDANTAASVMNLMLTAAGILFGVKGNAWREARLIKRGFRLVGTVVAEDAKGATANANMVAKKT